MTKTEPDVLRQAIEADLGGRYRIESVLARRPTGAVYKARELAEDRPVTLKVLPLNAMLLALGADLVPEFQREATLASSLRYSHLIPVTAYGTASNYLWWAMEYAEAPTLADLLQESGPLDLNTCTGIIDQVASALDYMHQRGVTHGAVRPTNIFVDEQNWARLSDMDIGSAVVELLTTDGPADLASRLLYAAPEKFEARSGGPMADQYSLAIVAYECLAGHPPFVASSPDEVGRLHRLAEPAPLLQQRNDIPAHVDHAIRRALSKAPHNRFTKIIDFASMLRGGSWAPERSPTRPASAVPLTPPRVLMGDPVRERFPMVARATASLRAFTGIGSRRRRTRSSRDIHPDLTERLAGPRVAARDDRNVVRFAAPETPVVRRTWSSPKWDRISAAIANYSSQSAIAVAKFTLAAKRLWASIRAGLRGLGAVLVRQRRVSAPVLAALLRQTARAFGWLSALTQRGWQATAPQRAQLLRLFRAVFSGAWQATAPARSRLTDVAEPWLAGLNAKLAPLWNRVTDVAEPWLAGLSVRLAPLGKVIGRLTPLLAIPLGPPLRYTAILWRRLATGVGRLTMLDNGWSDWGPLVARGQLLRRHKLSGASVLVVLMVAAVAFQPGSEAVQPATASLQGIVAVETAGGGAEAADDAADDTAEPLTSNGQPEVAAPPTVPAAQPTERVTPPTDRATPPVREARPVTADQTARAAADRPTQPPATEPARAGDTPPAAATARATPPTTTPPAPTSEAPAAANRASLLSVNSTPWGTLYVDGQEVGNTPKIDLPLAPGAHLIRIERDGFEAFQQEIRVAAGQRLRLTGIVLKRER